MQHFQISFYANHIDLSGKNDFASSAEIKHKFKFQGEEVQELSWEEKLIPEYYTPINQLETLKTKRMILIIWYCDEITKEQIVVGQVNIPLNTFQNPIIYKNAQQAAPEHVQPFMNMFEHDIVNTNNVVGKIDLKIVFEVRSTPNNLDYFLQKQHQQ